MRTMAVTCTLLFVLRILGKGNLINFPARLSSTTITIEHLQYMFGTKRRKSVRAAFCWTTIGGDEFTFVNLVLYRPLKSLQLMRSLAKAYWRHLRGCLIVLQKHNV